MPHWVFLRLNTSHSIVGALQLLRFIMRTSLYYERTLAASAVNLDFVLQSLLH
jgi:hypothetical protein